MSDPQSQRQVARQSAIESYDGFYAQEGRLRETNSFYRWILDSLPAQRGALLDVACGEGHLVHTARRRHVDAYGVDFSPRAIQSARKLSRENVWALADGEELPFARGAFDYVTNLGSLEHFLSPACGLQEMHRVIRPSGRVALVLPNSYYWPDIIWHVWRTGNPVSHHQTIERFATAGQWRALIEENGFEILASRKYNLRWPASFSDLVWYWRWPRKLLYPLLSPLTPYNLSYSFLFVCSPR